MAEQRYTLQQAAVQTGVSAENLSLILLDAGIDLSAPGRDGSTLTQDECDRLTRLVKTIGEFHAQTPFGNANV